MQVKKASTDISIYLHLRNSSDGTSKTGLLYNSAGAVASYVRFRSLRTAITLATLASPDAAHADGGFIEVDGTNAKGLYRLDVPDAAFATGLDEVIIHIGFTGVFEESLAIELVDERAGNLKADAIDATKIAADAIGSSEFAQAAADKVWATAARALTDKAGFTISGTKTTLDALNDITAASVWAVATRALTDKADFALSAASRLAIWHELLTGIVTADTIGKLIKDNLNAPVGSIPTTPTLQATWTNAKAAYLDTAISSRSSHAAADIWTVGTRALTDKVDFALSAAGIDAIWDELTSGHLTSGSFGQRFQIVRTATAQAGGASTITLDASASAVNNFYNTEVLFITAGTGAGQSRKIDSYVGATKVATLASAWATVPDATSVFVIFPDSVETGTGATAQQVWEYATRTLTAGGDATAANQTTIINHLTDVKGTGFVKDTHSLKPILDLIQRTLGLTQENHYLDNATFETGKLKSARIRIYSDSASVGTANNVIATYDITATYDANGNLATYKVTKA